MQMQLTFRIPMVAICVGLAVKKQLRAGIVYNPITKELFQAQTGKGAFKNGFPIHVSSTKGISLWFFPPCHGFLSISLALLGGKHRES